MDTVSAQIPVEQEAHQPVGEIDAQSVQEPSHLEQHQGEPSASAPTSDGETTATDASATAQPEHDIAELLRIRQDYEAAQAKLQEQEQVMAQIKRMADEQQAQAANVKLRTEIQQEVASLLQRSGVEDDDVAATIAEKMFGRIDGTRQSYQQQMTEWQAQVESSYNEGLWAATKDGFADFLLKDKQLNPVVLPHLRQAKSQDEMVQIANVLQQTQQHYQQIATQNKIAEQEQARRVSGVDTVTGSTSGPIDAQGLKPGRNLDVLGAILNGV